jgi:hypothetical protein
MAHSEYEILSTKSRLTKQDIDKIWKGAALFDPSLKIRSQSLDKLHQKQVKPAAFTRARLFEHMARCEPALFSNFEIRPAFDGGRLTRERLLRELREGFPKSARARVRTSESVNYATIPTVVNRWEQAKSRFGVTDLHYIGTRFDRRIDTTGLNDFNLLPRGTDGYQSQDSLVISSAGGFTDSHSDDHSGSNHSFIGTKLWLLWDNLEGLAHGLEDVQRCVVYDRAAFEMSAFLSMRSSRWIFIGPGQTMFIPANLTHKVITLERYLGLGSFHAGLPGFPELLSFWAQVPPSWASPFRAGARGSVEFITQRAIRKMQVLKTASTAEQHRWGLPQMKVVLRKLLLKGFADPRWTEAGRANIRKFATAASQL